MALVGPGCGHARSGWRETPAQTRAVSQGKQRIAIRGAGPSRVVARKRKRSRRGLKQVIITTVRRCYLQNAEQIAISGPPKMSELHKHLTARTLVRIPVRGPTIKQSRGTYTKMKHLKLRPGDGRVQMVTRDLHCKSEKQAWRVASLA